MGNKVGTEQPYYFVEPKKHDVYHEEEKAPDEKLEEDPYWSESDSESNSQESNKESNDSEEDVKDDWDGGFGKKSNKKGKIVVAAIGVGSRLRAVLQTLLMRHGHKVELRALCDESREALEISKKWPYKFNVACYTNYDLMLEREKDIEWVLIGSRTYQHVEHCIASFDAGKHVYCESPVAITAEQCEEIMKAHRMSGRHFVTGFPLRHSPLFVKIKEIVDKGLLGPLVSIEYNNHIEPSRGGFMMRNWRRFSSQAGPMILERCGNDMDILNWIVGSVPTQVASFGGLNVFIPENKQEHPEEQEVWKTYLPEELREGEIDPFDSEKDIYDNQVCILEYRNGVRASFHTNSNHVWPQRKIIICGVNGTLEANIATGSLRCSTIEKQVRNTEINYAWKVEDNRGADALIVDDLVSCMGEDPEFFVPPEPGEESFLSVIICLSLDEASKRNKIVNLESYWETFNV